ncbi:hypothetical protein AURDEDRAFT_169956 [Auricularia subglabra TFB-10046 SS5]|uniref:Uncharacterized protein n=1 Tax=Auricularia subglabra (strain TFB-10046 / SS5) TaxID=717982 RepID=J0WX19_AURST|nr:hypothetical protein AURDEDRAFT_169956 [Auricularia subglabra TFB-10046 SS5]
MASTTIRGHVLEVFQVAVLAPPRARSQRSTTARSRKNADLGAPLLRSLRAVAPAVSAAA